MKDAVEGFLNAVKESAAVADLDRAFVSPLSDPHQDEACLGAAGRLEIKVHSVSRASLPLHISCAHATYLSDRSRIAGERVWRGCDAFFIHQSER